ncbi:transglutaminase TgpA family protein [Niveibacterium terrae]|uniref:transglutaminase TgpA family protein n=1 Tax=Niveibacterium terrae TaxID=3373598 RepID=UPI003A8C9C98
MSDKTPVLDLLSQRWACAAVAASVLPLIMILGFDTGTLALLPLAVQIARLALRRTAPLSRLLPAALAISTAVAVFAQHGTLFGRQAGLALLASLACLKLLESRTRRDLHVAVQLCFFLQLGYFLHEQSPLTALLAAASCLTCLAALLRVEQARLGFAVALRGSGRLLLISLPLTAALFLFFPRLDQPLWGLPTDEASARTGLSNDMSPGSIADLSLSSEIALRAEFPGPIPLPSQRYFRGPVLTDFDGRTWKSAPDSDRPLPPATAPATLRYTLTLEAHRQRWLLALEQAVPQPGQLLSRDHALLTPAPVKDRIRVAIGSRPDAGIPDESPERLKRALALPAGFNPRTLALGQKIRQQHPDPFDRLAAARAFLRSGHYQYTLRPPLLGQNNVDEFLFSTRQGFCEHFAGAFTVLMRASGVPARVVTGYQGGEINPVDRSLMVRQSDAHAWTEVWLPGKGWLRQDPTAIAAPQRIDAGMIAALRDRTALPVLTRLDSDLLRSLRSRLDALDHAWNTWVLGYNGLRQRELLGQLGFPDADWRILAAALSVSALLWQALVWFFSRNRAPKPLPIQRSWHKLCRYLAKQGFVALSSEGPLDYAARVIRTRPEWQQTLPVLALRYARLRFAPPNPADSPEQFEQAIRKWISEPSAR